MALTLITPPAVGSEPISLEEAKSQVLQGTDVDDDYLSTIAIPAARDRAEHATRRAFFTQTWDLVLDSFPREPWIEIPKPPLRSITHLKYRDSTGTLQTWTSTNYVVEAPTGPHCARGRLALAYGIVWPSAYGQMADVTIRFIAGYGGTDDMPPQLKKAMLLDVMTTEGRGPVDPQIESWVKRIYFAFTSHPTQRLQESA